MLSIAYQANGGPMATIEEAVRKARVDSGGAFIAPPAADPMAELERQNDQLNAALEAVDRFFRVELEEMGNAPIGSRTYAAKLRAVDAVRQALIDAGRLVVR